MNARNKIDDLWCSFLSALKMAASGGGAAGGGSVVWMAVWFCALWFVGSVFIFIIKLSSLSSFLSTFLDVRLFLRTLVRWSVGHSPHLVIIIVFLLCQHRWRSGSARVGFTKVPIVLIVLIQRRATIRQKWTTQVVCEFCQNSPQQSSHDRALY